MSALKPLRFRLPEEVKKIAEARNALRNCYAKSGLQFTPDGKFVGDLGEAIAVEMFDLSICQGKGIDAYLGKIPVQIKTTGRKDGGAAFRAVDLSHPKEIRLIVYYIDWDACEFEVLFNGLESDVRPKCKNRQQEVRRNKLLRCNSEVNEANRLPVIQKFSDEYEICLRKS